MKVHVSFDLNFDVFDWYLASGRRKLIFIAWKAARSLGVILSEASWFFPFTWFVAAAREGGPGLYKKDY